MRRFCDAMVILAGWAWLRPKMPPMGTELGQGMSPRKCRFGEVAPVCLWCYMDRFGNGDW